MFIDHFKNLYHHILRLEANISTPPKFSCAVIDLAKDFNIFKEIPNDNKINNNTNAIMKSMPNSLKMNLIDSINKRESNSISKSNSFMIDNPKRRKSVKQKRKINTQPICISKYKLWASNMLSKMKGTMNKNFIPKIPSTTKVKERSIIHSKKSFDLDKFNKLRNSTTDFHSSSKIRVKKFS